MNKQTLNRVQRRIDKLRNQDVSSEKLENIAKSLGRVRSKKGKEPNWVSTLLPGSRPIGIPHHGKPVFRYTAGNILDDLEKDIFELYEQLEK